MDYKEENKKTYNWYAQQFDQKFSDYFHTYVKSNADFFLEELSGKDIIDLGSGPGNHSAYFQEKGLKTKHMDIESWVLPEKSVDGAVYKTLAAELYGAPQNINDFDYLTEEIQRPLFLPQGWTFSSTFFGNSRFSELISGLIFFLSTHQSTGMIWARF